MNMFNTIKTLTPSDLSAPFASNFKDIWALKRGGGFWIWKFDVILSRLQHIPDGHYLCYIDAGCTVNQQGGRRLIEYMDMLDASKYDILA